MKNLILALCATLALGCAVARAEDWQPAAGHTQMPLWPGAVPDAKPLPEPEKAGQTKGLVAGRPWTWLSEVTRPTLTLYPARGVADAKPADAKLADARPTDARPTDARKAGPAVVVLPGGGFEVLAIDLEGTEICDWLTSKGIACILLKYRVPSEPYRSHCHCRPDDLVTPRRSLEDLQRGMGLVRLHAREWHIDPHRIGVMGFSAGGYLAAEISTKYRERLYAPVDAADKESARPDFAVLVYPGHLATDQDTLNPNVPVTRETPPTLLVQAENDTVDGVHQTLVYYTALAKAGVPVEMHLYAEGGHAFGLRRTAAQITGWPRLVEAWLHTIGITRE
ncbi:MAG TPA: alpha/beta hydrolase [Rhizomicrobium sp.]|jgi:acetyl esterase/lipase